MKLKLGIDNYSLRGLGWKARQLIDYAASLGLDALLLSGLEVFENYSPEYLREIKAQADRASVELQIGILSICPSSVLFNDRYGTAKEQLELALRVAGLVGSRIVRCVLGRVDDRSSPGGINARIEETVGVLRSMRAQALDLGIKVAVENHSGDLRSNELVQLIEEAGSDFVGATMDCGNALWALEDPLEHLEVLGPYALTTGIRDSFVQQTAEGIELFWTALGDGAVDFKTYFESYETVCPEVPVHLEIISGRRIPLALNYRSFWEAYPNVSVEKTKQSLGRYQKLHKAAERETGLEAGREQNPAIQKAELERSIVYCKHVLGLGRKN